MSPASGAGLASALERWIAALNACGRPDLVEAACTPEVVVRRFGWATDQRDEQERFEGHDAVSAWMARCRVSDVFAPAPVEVDAAAGLARFRVRWGDYENTGTWRVSLAADGRIATLDHHPDDLPEAWRHGAPEGMTLPE